MQLTKWIMDFHISKTSKPKLALTQQQLPIDLAPRLGVKGQHLGLHFQPQRRQHAFL